MLRFMGRFRPAVIGRDGSTNERRAFCDLAQNIKIKILAVKTKILLRKKIGEKKFWIFFCEFLEFF